MITELFRDGGWFDGAAVRSYNITIVMDRI